MDPDYPQGRLGLQRHRAARRGLSGRRAGRAQPEGPARLRHLRPRRAGCRRHRRSRPTCRRSCCTLPGPGWPWPRCAASPTCRWAASRWASPDRSSIPISSRATWACASEPVDMTEFIRRIDEGIYDPDEFARALDVGQGQLQEGREYNPPEGQRSRAAKGRGLGVRGQDGHDRPRPDGRQPAPGRDRLRRGGAGAQRHRFRASRASASGPTTSPTATFWRRSSTRPSTGTASASPSSWPPRTTA